MRHHGGGNSAHARQRAGGRATCRLSCTDTGVTLRLGCELKRDLSRTASSDLIQRYGETSRRAGGENCALESDTAGGAACTRGEELGPGHEMYTRT